jgi:Tfp pilus assembly protein PilO
VNQVREYRMPLFIAGGALLVALVLWVALIAPQNSKLSSLQDQTVTLQSQETALQARLAALQSEGQKLSSNCADLQKISTQIPSVTSPNDINAEESSFESQFNALAGSSGVTLAQFSGFAPATTTGVPATGGTTGSPAGVTAVPTTLTVQGNYGQITSFINGLDSFPRLFVIQKFVLAYGPATGGAGTTGSSGGSGSQSTGGSSGTASASVTGTPLWIGGQQTSPSAGPYNLQIAGSIYYTSTPNALTACSKATAAQSQTK